MAPSRGGHNRSHEFDDLLDGTIRDVDPEADDGAFDESSEDDSLDDRNNGDAREHYTPVSKSILRKSKDVALGPQYRGSKVSRGAISQNEDQDDPFDKRFGDEESEQSENLEFDDETSRSDSNAGSREEEEDEDEDEDEHVSNGLKRKATSDSGANGEGRSYRADILKKLGQERNVVTDSISQATRTDVDKGRAVKRQRTTFDSLLNTRIKLQKTLVASNTIVGVPVEEVADQDYNLSEAVKTAETAAFNLWSTLTTFRHELISARTGHVYNRTPSLLADSTEKLWSVMQAQDKIAFSLRDQVLQRWHDTVQGQRTSTLLHSNRVDNQKEEATVLDNVKAHLSNPERLLKRAHTPRSCAPLQLANRVSEDEKIYDDADFYGLLLKELLEQRSQDSVTAASVDLNFNLRKETKTRNNVDTKASKGRKLRYTVHEKLQNFMAPEDRSTWGERQTDELFGSLFGRKMDLAEGGREEEENEGYDEVEAGLMLFRG